MPRVFIVQLTLKRDETTGTLAPRFDVSPAAKYGELVFLASSTDRPDRWETLIPKMEAKLESYTSADYLLLTGSPALIGIATAIAADANDGVVNFLQWDGRLNGYTPIHGVEIFPSESEAA